MLKNHFEFDDRQFNTSKELALYLRNNFKKSLKIIDDESLMNFLNIEKPELYEKISSKVKEFEHKENILTFIIYMLDNNMGIVTPSYCFATSYDIAGTMRKIYPKVDHEIKLLFSDKVLSYIFWNEFDKTSELKYKRNYTFMLHIYENRMFDFTYYYYLFLHLGKNDVVRFYLDGNKMRGLDEITNYLALNIDRSGAIVDEIMRNPYILALMAIKTGIDVIAGILINGKKLEILKCLQSYSDVDLTPIIKRKMCYWLIFNYEKYEFETPVAKELRNEYDKLSRSLNLNSITDYIEIYDYAYKLYLRFIELFNHNKIVEFKEGITITDEDYYLNYRFNDEYVCKQFLMDNSLFNSVIHSDIHKDTVEREVLIDRLEEEKQEIIEFKKQVIELTKDLVFEEKVLSRKLFVSISFLILLLVSSIGIIVNKDTYFTSEINKYLFYGLVALFSVSLLIDLLSICKHSSKLKNYDFINDVLINTDTSLKVIVKEEELTLNRNESNEHRTLKNLSIYKKNRNDDLLKIKKISKKKTNVWNGFIYLLIIISVIPILEFSLPMILQLLDKSYFAIYLFDINISLISLIFFLINLVLVIIFRKKKIIYYLIYVYMTVGILLSIIF